MKKIRINFEKFSDGILIPEFPWPNRNSRFGREIWNSHSLMESMGIYQNLWF